MMYNVICSLATALLGSGAHVLAQPAQRATEPRASLGTRQVIFRDDFSTFDEGTWSCEYTCPTIETGKARFRLQSGVPPDESGSWSKARYTPQQFTSGRFTVRFSLTSRPEQAVWWGVALWDDGSAEDGSEYNEINFGYTTDQSYTNTQLRFESAKNGKAESLFVETNVDLYDEQYHTATLAYNSETVSFYLDDELLKEITDTSVIPTDPMDLLLGPRLVTGSEALTEGFTESIDWVEIQEY